HQRVFASSFTSRGWLDHFHYDPATQQFTTKPTGGFGWDITPSLVPASMVPSYTGTSPYLLMTKYNNYASHGGNGVNKLAILDPNDTETETGTGRPPSQVMKE